MNVYKYRGGSPEILARDLDSLIDNYFWAPTADQLNDPTDTYVNGGNLQAFFKVLGAHEVDKSIDDILKMRHQVGVYSLSKNSF